MAFRASSDECFYKAPESLQTGNRLITPSSDDYGV